MKVFINPGHAPGGNPDPGAIGPNRLRECDVAAAIGGLLEKYLTAAGVEVVGNVQNDSLYYVADQANASSADLFVSIHCNAAEDSRAHGTETLCYSRDSQAGKLALCIQDQIIDALHTTDRGVKARPGLYVLRTTAMPAVLVETAFISNPAEERLLASHQDDFARAIARGVTDYQLL